MNSMLLDLLRCPATGEKLYLTPESAKSLDEAKSLVAISGNTEYPIVEGIPRFVPSENYSDSFGVQWNLFRETQLDSRSGIDASADRFWGATGWNPNHLEGKITLDAGCGAGRFAEIAAGSGALVVCIDYSSAVSAAKQNLGDRQNVLVLQADINSLPFARESFDYIYSLGVLQHTPDPEQSFKSLPKFLKSDGHLCADFYEKSWRSLLHPKYWLRHITTRMPDKVTLRLLKVLIPILYPIGRLITLLPMGSKLRKIFPIADPIYFYERRFGKTSMSYKARLQWSLLDTYDWLTPSHDNPQTRQAVSKWAIDADLKEVEIENAGHLVVRGVRYP